MSLATLTGTHTLTITRSTFTRDASYGEVRAYTAAARGSSPTSVQARAIPMTVKERSQFGVRGSVKAWKFLMTSDPEVTLEDQIEFDYVSGQSEVVKVLTPSHALHPDGRLWRIYGEVDTTDI